MEFKKLLGRRIYLSVPEEASSAVILDKATKEAMQKEQLKKWARLKVYAVGSGILEEVKPGDEVMIDPSSASRVIQIPLSDDRDVILISIDDIAHIW